MPEAGDASHGLLSDQARNCGDFRKQGRGAVLETAVRACGHLNHVERAVSHRLEYTRGVGPHAVGHDHNRAWRPGHDSARGFHAVHAREQVHQDEIRRLLRAERHGLGDARPDPDDAMLRLQGQRPQQQLRSRAAGR